MTTDRDFDRLAQAWLELGPDEAPERTVAAILQVTEAMPQVRRGFRWPAWRNLTMSRSSLLIGAWAAVLVAVAGVAMVARPEDRRVDTTVTQPSTVAATPAASAAAAATLDPGLIGQWIGDNRPIQEIPLGDGARLIFSDVGTGSITPADNPSDRHMTSSASTNGGLLRLITGATPDAGCNAGDIGTYSWSISASGRLLVIEAGQDDCIPRLASIPGSWWRIGCHDIGDGCLGDLDAGTYRTTFVKFHPEPPGQLSLVYGNLTYTVPDGWANPADCETGLQLQPSADYARSTGPNTPRHGIAILANPAVAAQDPACPAADEAGIDPTADAMIRAISRLPGVTASIPTPISINLRHGQMVDLTLAPSWTGTCPGTDGLRSAPVIREADPDAQNWVLRLTEGERWRLIILDLGGGHTAAIVIDDNESDARFNELAAQAMPVVRSLHFR